MSYTYTLSHSFTFEIGPPLSTQRLQDALRQLGEAYAAVIPFEQRRGTNISIHRPESTVVCITCSDATGQKVWHVPQHGSRAQVINEAGDVCLRGMAYGPVMIGDEAHMIVDRDEQDWEPRRLVVPSRYVQPEGM